MKDLLLFLQQLEVNNNKDWMDAHRSEFQQIRGNFLELATDLLRPMMELEPEMALLRPKDCVFRQNRDVRFSLNKNPYKVNMAAYFAVGGKKSDEPGYYLHIQPGASFIGGGIFGPSSDLLKRIRQEIDYSGDQMISILDQPEFKSHFGKIEGERLKTSPRDYAKDHPFIDLLRLKSFVVRRPCTDEEVTASDFQNLIMEHFRLMKPINDFLSRAVEETEGGEGLL